MSIQEHLNKIRNAIYGREVRESIAKGIETAYDDASENGNANMEVKIARGTHPNLRSRLEEVDNKQQQTTTQLAEKASNDSLNVISNSISDFNNRVDKIIATPTTVSEQEIIDARQKEASLGANIAKIKKDFRSSADIKVRNLIENGGFDYTLKEWTFFRTQNEIVNGRLRVTEDATNTEHYAQYKIKSIPIKGNKYYMKFEKFDSGALQLFYKQASGAYKTVTISLSNEVIFEVESVADIPEWFLRVYGKMGVYQGDSSYYDFDNFMLIDLTSYYGKGNEPSLSEFNLFVSENGGYWEDDLYISQKKLFNEVYNRLEESEKQIQALQAMGSGGTPSVKYPSPETLSATYYPISPNIPSQIKADVIIGYRYNRVVKSLDGGITWVDFASTMPNLPVNGQYVHLMDDGYLLVFGIETATNDGVILRSSNTEFNSTTTWIEIKRISGKSFPGGNPYGIHVNGHIVLGSTYPSNSPVFISTDYGQTFTDIFTKSITHIHHSYIDPYDKTIWVATGDGTIHRNLYYSNDYGTTWDSVWTEGTAPTQITSVISRPECVLFGTDVNNEYAVWRYDKKTQQISKVFYGGTTEISSVCSLGVMAYNQETNDGLITWLPFQAEDDTKRWRLIATPDGVNYYVVDEPADLTIDKNLNSVIGTFNNKLIVRTSPNSIAHYDLPEWKDL